MELWLTVNGKRTCASAPLDPLTRAVVISLFKGKQRCGSGGVVSGWRPFSCGGCYGVGPALPPERAADG